jgi:ankyrin repeat protein
VNKRDKFGETALIAAAYSGNVEAVRLLITRNSEINVVGEEGSALHVAKDRGHAQIASILQSHGAVDRH